MHSAEGRLKYEDLNMDLEDAFRQLSAINMVPRLEAIAKIRYILTNVASTIFAVESQSEKVESWPSHFPELLENIHNLGGRDSFPWPR